MRRVTRRHRHKLRHGGDQLLVFVILVAIFVLGRIVFVNSLILAEDCKDLQPLLLGRDGTIDSSVDTNLLVTLVAAGLLAATIFNTLMTRKMKALEITFACINASFIMLLACVWLSTWAFFHPWHPLSSTLYSIGFQQDDIYPLSMEPVQRVPPSQGWTQRDTSSFVNQDLKIIAQYETVKTCWPAEFKRRHLEILFPSGTLPDGSIIADLTTSALTHPDNRFVYYDLEGNYITSEHPTDHYVVKSLKVRDAERDSLRPNVDIWHQLNIIQESWHADPTLPERQHPYSQDEIDAMVAQAWQED